MGKMSEIATGCELMLMGNVIPVKNEEVQLCTEYLLGVMHCDREDYDAKKEAEEVMRLLYQYDSDHNYNVRYMVCNTLMTDFRVITYLIEAPDEELAECEWRLPDQVKDLANTEQFSYVYNVDAPELSELGYTFYAMDSYHKIYRVG